MKTRYFIETEVKIHRLNAIDYFAALKEFENNSHTYDGEKVLSYYFLY